jgi:glutathione synthase/RimK-type ligase-like ATP-grasp enzyme
VRILLCIRGGAHELPAVVDALRGRRAEPVVFDASKFPDRAPLTLSYDGGAFRGRGSADSDALDGIAAVWQNAVVGTDLPAMAPGVRETCVAASELALVGLLDNLHVFQLDPHGSQARADSKPRQLRVAQQLGLEIPDTIISNDPDAVRGFARRHRGVITKMLVQPASTGPEPGDEVSAVFTTAMTAADLDQLDGLDLCPMIFQEQIDNQLDVRVTIVGKHVFAAAIDAAARGGGDPDWRRDSYAHDRAPVWASHELPRILTDRLVGLLDHFGLNFGAIDLIVRPDGRYVFLELNARGSFAFLGDDLTGPIAAAIADVLLDPGARRGASHA